LRNNNQMSMSSLLIVGAGSFSTEVEELARYQGFTDIAFLDDKDSSAIGTMKDIGKVRGKFDTAIVAMGNNENRRKYHEKLKLHAMYLSYLLKEATIFDYKMNCDDRGSFTELVRTPDRGQVSINISKPGITKGQHWHDCKNEIFIVVKGHGLIQMRNLKDNEVEEYEVSGDHIQGVWMKPGWTHNIINLSDTEDLVTVMWASEMLDR
jgi:dTDP-4-dehydrorhamnose 3,5-epimerase-like enzyme